MNDDGGGLETSIVWYSGSLEGIELDEFRRCGGYGEEGSVRFLTSPSEFGDLFGLRLNAAADIVLVLGGGAGNSRDIGLPVEMPDPDNERSPIEILGGPRSSITEPLGDGGPGDTVRFAKGKDGGARGELSLSCVCNR